MIEVYNSDGITLENEHLGNWLTCNFETPFLLDTGSYIIAVGQNEIQGHVGFGNEELDPDYQGKLWCKFPIDYILDGSQWLEAEEYLKVLGPGITKKRLERLDNFCVMLKLEILE